MIRKIAILMPMFFLCLTLDNCKSPEAPKELGYEYRYNVEVIYTRIAVKNPNMQENVTLNYHLNDPSYADTGGWLNMDKIETNKYRCYLPRVFIQTVEHPEKHRVTLDDWRGGVFFNGENIHIQGAYDQEIKEEDWSTFFKYPLLFRMSKE